MIDWWNGLELQWRRAFGEVFFGHQEMPSEDELYALIQAEILRFSGPAAPYPNMSFQLTNVSGLQQLTQLKIVVITFHDIHEIADLKYLKGLKALFLFNNKLESLTGIEEMLDLEQLYVQFNQINSLGPIRNLIHLQELYVHDNELSTLDGLTEAHADDLAQFYCKPNMHLKQRELLKVENAFGIRCSSI